MGYRNGIWENLTKKGLKGESAYEIRPLQGSRYRGVVTTKASIHEIGNLEAMSYNMRRRLGIIASNSKN